MYPGCIAESDLFRNHTSFFRWLFPLLQKNVTKGYVSEQEAGERLASIVCDPRYDEQGAYWAWKGGGDQLWDNYNNNDDETRTIAFNNKPSKEGRDMDKAIEMLKISSKIVRYTPRLRVWLVHSFRRDAFYSIQNTTSRRFFSFPSPFFDDASISSSMRAPPPFPPSPPPPPRRLSRSRFEQLDEMVRGASHYPQLPVHVHPLRVLRTRSTQMPHLIAHETLGVRVIRPRSFARVRRVVARRTR